MYPSKLFKWSDFAVIGPAALCVSLCLFVLFSPGPIELGKIICCSISTLAGLCGMLYYPITRWWDRRKYKLLPGWNNVAYRTELDLPAIFNLGISEETLISELIGRTIAQWITKVGIPSDQLEGWTSNLTIHLLDKYEFELPNGLRARGYALPEGIITIGKGDPLRDPAQQIEALFKHELSHIFYFKYTGEWTEEGLAELSKKVGFNF